MMHANGRPAAYGRVLALAVGLILAGCNEGSSPTSTITTSATNTAAVTVGFGALGPSGGYVNGIWTSVIVCTPGSTTSCETIPNVLVDTGSYGLRVLSSALTVSLPGVQLGGNALQECVQFADFAYAWGPVSLASVQIAGTEEKALQVPGQTTNSGIPIQILAASPAAPVPSSCLSTPATSGLVIDLNTLENLGANGILGIGSFPQDCGAACATQSVPQYYVCPGGACSIAEAPAQQQVWNPVAAFSSADNNGILLTLPAVTSAGAVSVTGSLIFGVGTQSNNKIGSEQIYEIDGYGNFPQVVFNGVTYTSPNNGSFIDTGSEVIFFSDATSLASTGIVECASNLAGLYCPASTIPFTVTPYGANSVHSAVPFNIANASALFSTGNAAINDMGGDSGSGPATDYVDLGLPFFLGRQVFVGISGSNSAYPNGYWAF